MEIVIEVIQALEAYAAVALAVLVAMLTTDLRMAVNAYEANALAKRAHPWRSFLYRGFPYVSAALLGMLPGVVETAQWGARLVVAMAIGGICSYAAKPIIALLGRGRQTEQSD